MSSERIHQISMAIVNGITSLIGFIGNTLVLVVLLKNREYFHGINVFLGALAITDLMVCGIVQPVFIYLLFGSFNTDTLRAFGDNFFAVMIQMSLNILLCIAISRFLEITRPFVYRSFATKSRIAITILIVSIISTVQGILFNTVSSMEFAEPFFQYTTIAVFLFFYGRIYLIARKHKNEILCQTRALAFNHGPTGKRFARLRNSTITTAIITGAFLVCFLPFSILNMLDNEDTEEDEYEAARFWISTIVCGSSCLNAYIYALRSETFKNAIKKEFRTKCCFQKENAVTDK